MRKRLRPDMLEATRLTRAGRLAEATALVQRLLGGGTAPGATSDDAAQASGTDAGGHVLGAAGGAGRPHLPKALRGLLRRVHGAGFEPGADGPAEPSRAGASGAADSGRFIDGSYSDQAGARAYKLYIPTGYRGQAVPLVVMLHGCTQSPDDFAAGTGMNALAEERTCLVAYPAQAASANGSKCWNWFSPTNQRRGQGEPSLIAGITRQIMRDYAVDPRRVYAAGLSAGAATAAIMGITYPDLYAAIGVHSGLAGGAASDLPSALAAMRQGKAAAVGWSGGVPDAEGLSRVVPTIVFHGDQDSTVHPRNGDHVIAQSRAGAASLRMSVQRGQVPGGHAYSRTIHADAGGRAILEQWIVHGAGHAWSGGSPAGSYTDPQGPDASREMLRFFLEHPHPAAAWEP